jgi:2-phosphoglycerate kinase
VTGRREPPAGRHRVSRAAVRPAAHDREGAPIQIVSNQHGLPFSKGLLAQSLTATGLSPERAYRVARAVQDGVRGDGLQSLTVDELEGRVQHSLIETEGSPYSERYAKWQRLALQDQPVIILIGGTTGVGKSTLASQLAHRLGIVRLISTDAIRQVMRAFFSSALMPAIHFSSFDAAGAVRIPVGKNLDPALVGFVEQVEMVNVGVGAIIDRAVSEGTGMVLEGVHLVPGFTGTQAWDEALVLPMVVMVDDAELHRSHFLVRARETDGRRPFDRYLGSFDAIRKIQDFIVSRARQEGTLIIENVGIDETVGMVVEALYDLIGEREDTRALAMEE